MEPYPPLSSIDHAWRADNVPARSKTTANTAKPAQVGDAKPRDLKRVGRAAAEDIDDWFGVPAYTMKVAVVQQYSHSSNARSNQNARESRAVVGALVIFMVFGFLAGLGILLIRNSYLFFLNKAVTLPFERIPHADRLVPE